MAQSDAIHDQNRLIRVHTLTSPPDASIIIHQPCARMRSAEDPSSEFASAAGIHLTDGRSLEDLGRHSAPTRTIALVASVEGHTGEIVRMSRAATMPVAAVAATAVR